jgi:hypothetical protein
MSGRGGALIAAAVLVLSSTAAAQSAGGSDRGTFTVSAGVVGAGGYDVGGRSAELPRNGTAADPVVLFRTESSVAGTPGVDARLAYAVSRRVSLEVAGTFVRPSLDVRITRDSEGAGDTVASESIGQFTLEAGALVQLPLAIAGGALQPYVNGGAGYLRQLHQDRLLVETGHVVYAGGGAWYWLRRRPGARALGVRAETAVVARYRGIDFEDKARVYPRVSALGCIRF